MSRPSTGLVLSGGGARGAYEAGVLDGIVAVLDDTVSSAPFDVFCGTSVGAINAAWLAAHAHRPDMNVAGLVAQWRELRLDTHLRLRPIHTWLRALAGVRGGTEWSLLDVGPVAELVTGSVPWQRLHGNIAAGRVRALVLAALHVATGRTTLFAELAPDATFRPSRDPRRQAIVGPISADHVLASSALPFLYPARRVGRTFYCDGGLRFNTPLAPAIRCGADRLVVVSLLHEAAAGEPTLPEPIAGYPSPTFLAGKTLNALLLDPIVHDLQVLERFNRLVEVLERALEDDAMAEVERVTTETRGVAYRRLETLVFRPSQDIGRLAATYLDRIPVRRPSTWLLSHGMRAGASNESDLLSFLLFDRAFVDCLLQLGRDDVWAQADAVRAFFGAGT